MTAALVPIFAALSDDTRWAILQAVGERDLSASALARSMPVSRQAIAGTSALNVEAGERIANSP